MSGYSKHLMTTLRELNVPESNCYLVAEAIEDLRSAGTDFDEILRPWLSGHKPPRESLSEARTHLFELLDIIDTIEDNL